MKRTLRRTSCRWTLGAAVAMALAASAACGRGGPAEEPAASPAPVQDLSAAEIMVLPVQRVAEAADPQGLAGALDAEIEYWARERSPGLRWTFPGELARVTAREPTLGVPLHALPVGVMRREPDFVPDPLLGHLRRLGAVTDRRFALLPWQAEVVMVPQGTGELLRLHLVLLDTHGGKVLWRGAISGEPGEPGDPAAAATAARALARALLP